MNKNIIIGVLVVIVLIGVGFYFFNNNNTAVPVVNNTPVNTTPVAPVVQSTPTFTPGAPIVQTNQNNSVSSSTAELAGLVTPNGASATYWFDYGTSTAFGNESSAQAIGSGYSSISATGFISGLSANTSYYYRLSAKNKFSTVNGAMYSFQTNNNPPVSAVKSTAQTNAATNISNTTATLNGQVNPNGFETNYWFEYGKDANLGNTNSTKSIDSNASASNVSESLSNLEPLTKYYFRLNAQNQFGTVTGQVLNFTTSGPVAATDGNSAGRGETAARRSGNVASGSDRTAHRQAARAHRSAEPLGGAPPRARRAFGHGGVSID